MCTANPTKGFKEIVRVLKRGGKLFLSVYGRGGVKWALCDIMRVIGKVIPFQTMVKIWRAAGVPANKRYNFLDNFYIPKMARYTEREVREWLVESGFENIRRVKFERYDYEKLLSRIIHGEGWLQFYADKK
jgi:ubiquinone/menaquinone biosynthesis C-methylase UbiE